MGNPRSPDAPLDETLDSSPHITAQAMPTMIGRFQVTGRLGVGGFGAVYRAFDPALRREVAIKTSHQRVAKPAVPLPPQGSEQQGIAQQTLDHRPDISISSLGSGLTTGNAQLDRYLSEARHVARLDHPGIVPVYDVGQTDDGLCYVVSKFIAGGSLAEWLKAHPRPTPLAAAHTVADVAQALHHAHERGLVHRDVKPANILLDGPRQPGVAAQLDDWLPVTADFGLALDLAEFGRGEGFSGTPAYMSPEQARGEGHTVDARSDVYSLGIVLFELLTGRLPYRAESVSALLNEIANVEVRPPRQLDPNVPAELDRICLRAVAKKPAERFSTAADMAAELRAWCAAQAPAPAGANAIADTRIEGTEPAAKGPRATASLSAPGCVISVTVSLAALLVAVYLGNPLDQEFAHVTTSLPPQTMDFGEKKAVEKKTVDPVTHVDPPKTKGDPEPKKATDPVATTTPVLPEPKTGKRPLTVNDWLEVDFCSAALDGAPELVPFLQQLLDAKQGNEKVENLLVTLLQPAAMVELVKKHGRPVPEERKPLDEKATVVIVNALVDSSSPHSGVLLESLLQDKYDLQDSEPLVTRSVLTALFRSTSSARQKLATQALFQARSFRQGFAEIKFQKLALELLPQASPALLTHWATQVAAGEGPAGVVQVVLARVIRPEPQNVPAQVELFLKDKLPANREAEVQDNLTRFAVRACDVVLAGAAPKAQGEDPLSLDEARAICQALWRDEMTEAVWARFAKITDAREDAALRRLLHLAGDVATPAAREKMLSYINAFGNKVDPTLMVEGNAPFGSQWADPAMWHAVRQLDDRYRFPPSRTGRVENKHRWFEASRQYLKTLNARCYQAAQYQAPDPAIAGKRPIQLPEGAKVTAELRVDWPAGAAGIPNAPPLVLHYIRTEEQARLEDRDRDHYGPEAKSDGKLPKRRYLLNAQGVEEARWLESLFRTEPHPRSLDVVITRVRPDGAPAGLESLVVETLLIETPR